MATISTTPDAVQQLKRDKVDLLWHSDYWDGPINGLCLYDGKKCWFELWTTDDEALADIAERRFLVFQLTPEQLAEEERWHELFREKVGTHCDYDEPHPEVKPQESHREFYEAYQMRAKPDYSTNPVLGWFTMD